jgi:polysaccharide biosynthesis transport protein
MQAAILEPLSRFSDILRSVRVAIDAGPRSSRAIVLGTISAFSGEGKSVVSSNLALSLGASGARVLLIDADLRRAGLSRAYSFSPDCGLPEVLAGTSAFKDALRPVGHTGVWFLGCDPGKPVADSSALLASEPMSSLIARASSVFDYIVVDLPPLGIIVDALAADKFIDQYLLVVGWGETQREVVKEMLTLNSSVERKCLGVLLNKASDVGLRRYLGDRQKMYVYDQY